jgi:hypothetical protein
MGAILAKYYEYVQQKAGFVGKTELAKLTKLPQMLAATQPDSPENIRKFEAAVAKVTGAPAPKF